MQKASSSQNSAIISEGLRVGFRANRSDLMSNFSSVLAPGSVPTDFANLDFVYSLAWQSRSGTYAAYLGSRTLIRHGSLQSAFESIESDLQHTIAAHSRRHLFVHAGVVGWRGRAILFPGRTYSGKSTLVQALIRAGAVYFSDEFARIDASGLVHSFPRPVALRSAQGRSTLHPEKEGLKVATGPCRAGAIVATEYRVDGVWDPVCLSPGYATLELLNNTVAVRSDPAKAVRYTGKLASSAAAIRSARGEAEATVPLLLQTLDRLLN
jgi:hypothetical protein